MEINNKTTDIQKKGFNLAKSVYEVTKNVPSEERKGLFSQMRNIAISIPSNIDEGVTQKTKRDAEKYYIVARGLINKLDNHVAISHSLGMIDVQDYHKLETQIDSVETLLSEFIRTRKLKSK